MLRAALNSLAAAAAAFETVTVQAPSGAYEGRRDAGVDSFLGIRYARAPIGPLRFLPAVPTPKHEGVYAAEKYGGTCYQHGCDKHPEWPKLFGLCSEDCLFLNVWRPAATNASSALPVMVWIHGGGMIGGAGGSPGAAPNPYDGAAIAGEQRVVLITINYRLGPLGFFASGELRGASGGATGGANGIHDQIVALRWVQANAAAFGGDPSRVMAFGESAGSVSVGVLSVSPLGKGLFYRAGMESGAPVGLQWQCGSVADGLSVGARLMRAHNASTVDDLRGVAPGLLTWDDVPHTTMPCWHDGVVLPRDGYIRDQWAAGALNVDAALLGANHNDGTLVWMPETMLPARSNASADFDAKMRAYWGTTYPAQTPDPGAFDNATVAAIRAHYTLSSTGGNAIAAFVQADGDFNVVCPTLRIASQAAKAGRKIYLFLFEHLWAGDFAVGNGWAVPPNWACHTSEIEFVFGNNGGRSGIAAFGAGDAQLSRAMQGYWASFARDGAPAAGGAPSWPAFDGDARGGRALSFSATAAAVAITAKGDYRSDLCRFWEPLF